jgi:predicted DNA-binding transcriptional regulator YafY
MRADRLLSMLLLLQARNKLTAAELADELEVSKRTVLRDVEALSVANVPIYSQKGPGGGIFLDEQYRLILSGFQQSELQGLFVSGFPKFLAELGLNEPTQEGAEKLYGVLPKRHQSAIKAFQQRIHIDPKWWWYEETPPAFWPLLQQAVYEDKRVRVVYEKHDKEIQERILEPYGLVAKASVWYLIAKRDGEFRSYRVSRFHNVQLLNEPFTRDPAFDLASFWERTLATTREYMPSYQCTLRVPQASLEFLRYYVPGNAEITEISEREGWSLIELRVMDMHSARMLILGLDGQVEIIEPEKLKETVLQSAKAVLEVLPEHDNADQ